MNLKRKPVIVVSRCLGFGVCRWNGAVLESPLVAALQNEVDFIPVCPECEIGLGCPRPPIRLVRKDLGISLIQPETGIDLTSRMVDFSQRFLCSLSHVDGFLLKRKSPSCGLADIPIYAAPAADSYLDKTGTGLFARAASELFPKTPKIDEAYAAESFLKLLL